MSKKTLCEWDKKEIEKNWDMLINIVEHPKFICRKCARSANSAEHLCKPVKIKKAENRI